MSDTGPSSDVSIVSGTAGAFFFFWGMFMDLYDNTDMAWLQKIAKILKG